MFVLSSFFLLFPEFPDIQIPDRLAHLPSCWTTQTDPNPRACSHRRDLWSSSTRVCVEAQVGYDRLDVLLHRRYSCVLFLLAFVFILEDG
jgi:hypothetical protein